MYLNGILYSFSGLAMEFNETIEYSLFAFFAWNLFDLAAVLVTMQFELVEYTYFNVFYRNTLQTDLFLTSLQSEMSFFLYFHSGLMIRVYLKSYSHFLY